MASARRDVEQLVQEAERQGWKVTRTGKNRYEMQSPAGAGAVFISSTPNDRRAILNVVVRMRRLGFSWKGR